MESSIVYGSAKIKAAPRFKRTPKSDQQLEHFLLYFGSFYFPSFSRQKQRLQLVGFLKTNNPELYDFAASRCPNWKIERKACLIDWLPHPSFCHEKVFLGERQGLSAIFSFRLNLAARESWPLFIHISS